MSIAQHLNAGLRDFSLQASLKRLKPTVNDLPSDTVERLSGSKIYSREISEETDLSARTNYSLQMTFK